MLVGGTRGNTQVFDERLFQIKDIDFEVQDKMKQKIYKKEL